jgi:hypothetical protein
MVVSTSTDQPQTQSPKSYKNNLFKFSETQLNKNTPKNTHTHAQKHEQNYTREEQPTRGLHPSMLDSPLKSATPGLHPTPFPWASSF